MKKNLLYLFIILGFYFLFNNNIKAYTIYSDDNITVDEKYIYRQFLSAYNDFSFEEFPYITCTYRFSDSQNISCSAFSSQLMNNLIIYHNSYGNYSFKNNEVVASWVNFKVSIYNNFGMGYNGFNMFHG